MPIFLNIRLFLIVVLTFLMVGCATKTPRTVAPKVASNLDVFEYSGKIQIKNLAKAKSQTVSYQSWVSGDDQLRIDLKGPVGLLIAQLILKEDRFIALNHLKKRAYTGSAKQAQLKNLIGADIAPQTLISVFRDQPITGSDWACVKKAEILSDCAQQGSDLNINFTERSPDQRRVIISNKLSSLNLIIKTQTKVEGNSQPFILEIPESYKRYQLKN